MLDPVHQELGLRLRDCLALAGRYEPKPSPATLRSTELAEAARLVVEADIPQEKRRVAFAEFVALRRKQASAFGDLSTRHGTRSELGGLEILAAPRSLLVTDFDGDIFDGAAEAATHGFFDHEYNTPWDTWLALEPVAGAVGAECILSWVPPWAADLAECAIRVDPTGCLAWAHVEGVRVIPHAWGERWKEHRA